MERLLSRALVAWMDLMRRRARRVLVTVGVTTLAVLGYAATHLGVYTHHTAILSDDLPFWRAYHEFAEVFPILDEVLLVVVDAETSAAARAAAATLAERLEEESDLFQDVYVPGGDPFFERNGLLYLGTEELQNLSDQLATAQPLLAEISRDPSLTNLSRVLQEGIERARTHPETPIDLTLAFDSLSRATQAVLEGRPRPISWTELILERKLPGDSVRRLLVLQPAYDFHRLVPGREAIDRVREAARELGLVPENGVTVRITGNVALNTEEMLGLARSAVLGVGGSLLVVGLILAVALRSLHLVVSALATLLVSLVWTAGFAALAVGHVNVVSVAFAILVIGLGIDFGIHFSMRYAELLRADGEHAAALEETARSVGGSLVLCALTTAMGFYVFVPTDYKAVGELGLIAGTGMLVSLVSSLTVLPALLTTWRGRDPGTSWGGALWFERIVITAASHHPGRVRWGAALLGLLSLTALPAARFDHNVANLRDPDTESVQTFNELLSDSETAPWTMDVMASSLEEAAATAERLRELDVVERAVTLRDYVPDEQAEKLEILLDLGYFVPPPPPEDRMPREVPLAEQIATLHALQASLDSPWLAEGDPKRAASAARAARRMGRFLARLEAIDRKAKQAQLAAFERSLTATLPDQLALLWKAVDPQEITLESLPRVLAGRMLSPDGRARVEVLAREDLSDNAAHTRFVDTVKSVVPDATGSAVILLEFGRAVVRSFGQALLSATFAVALLLWVLWRRLGDMALVIVPLTLAALLTVASTVVLDIPFNFGNVIVLPLLLGIGVDSGIHLVHRHRVTIETTGHAEPPERELLETSTAQAVFFSALTTMASFGTMAFSNHFGFATLGWLLLLGVGYTLLANLLLLPALIAWRSDEEGEGGPPGAGSSSEG
jgi:hopanoid biosynthesis associated RND transporter like protein HpnN